MNIKCVVLTAVLFAALCVPARGLRIVSLTPATTDAICAIGGRHFLVGKSSACRTPGTENIPVAGNMGLPAMEKVFALKATHVISDSKHPEGNWQLLMRAGIKVIVLPGKKISDFPANLRLLGRITGLERAAENVAAKYERDIAELIRTRPRERRRVLIVLGIAPVISCGKTSFIDEAAGLAGGENICGKIPRDYFSVATEFILKSNPEVIIFAGLNPVMVKQYFARAEFRNVTAVKNGKIISVDADKFCRAGSGLPDAIKTLRLQIL